MSSIATELLAAAASPVVAAQSNASETVSDSEGEVSNPVMEYAQFTISKHQETWPRLTCMVLQCLKNHSQCLDLEIAEETGISLATVREELANLEAAKEIITCSLTRFEKGKRTDALECRVLGYSPRHATGPKPKAET